MGDLGYNSCTFEHDTTTTTTTATIHQTPRGSTTHLRNHALTRIPQRMRRVNPTSQNDQTPQLVRRRQVNRNVRQQRRDPQRHLRRGGRAERHQSPSNLRRRSRRRSQRTRRCTPASSPGRRIAEQTVSRHAHRAQRRARPQNAVIPLHRRRGLEQIPPFRNLVGIDHVVPRNQPPVHQGVGVVGVSGVVSGDEGAGEDGDARQADRGHDADARGSGVSEGGGRELVRVLLQQR
mmetsp:Transcript_38306/g.82531  ORF Transcript_38306/g.82531 Transcript_38306/m.82531 type:complete len:234 (-) Transcript_38306:412-1113(-)